MQYLRRRSRQSQIPSLCERYPPYPGLWCHQWLKRLHRRFGRRMHKSRVQTEYDLFSEPKTSRSKSSLDRLNPHSWMQVRPPNQHWRITMARCMQNNGRVAPPRPQMIIIKSSLLLLLCIMAGECRMQEGTTVVHARYVPPCRNNTTTPFFLRCPMWLKRKERKQANLKLFLVVALAFVLLQITKQIHQARQSYCCLFFVMKTEDRKPTI